MKQFKGRVVVGGKCQAEALVSRAGFNTLASFQGALQFGDIPILGNKYKQTECDDQNNKDLYRKPMQGKALCLPQTIGSTTGGMVLYCANSLGKCPACLLFSEHIDSLAAAGAALSANWCDKPLVTIDCLGQEFLDYVQDGMKITVDEDGTVTVE